jgi:superfamily II DNA or RNA helicase
MLTLAQDITQTIIERGELSKADIQRLWSIDDESYNELQRELASVKLLQPGGRGRGGFRARYAKPPKRADESIPSPEFEHDWQNRGVERLAELLSHARLEELLGDLVYTVRRARQQMTGEDRRGNKRELAAALTIQHDIDLLRDTNVRKAVARACKLKPPGRWHPGKGAAIDFARDVGFPPEFAGLPSPETPPDFEYLEGRFNLQPLQDFQEEVQADMRRVIDRPGGRAIVTLPTGAGKTRVAVDTIRDWLTDWRHAHEDEGRVVLWLAHTEELCEQAFTCFKQVWEGSNNVSPLMLFRFWGRYTQDLIDHRVNLSAMHQRPTVLISTPQRLVGLIEERVPMSAAVLQDILALTALLVVDEAHRAATAMYQTILDAFRQADSAAALVGLTATPFRGEYDPQDPIAGTEKLKRIFRRIIEPAQTLGEDPRRELQKRGYLASPIWREIKTKTLLRPPPLDDLEALTDEDIEKVDYVLKIRADNSTRRLTVLEHLLPICTEADTKILYFGPTVLDAECMAFLLRQQGVSSAFVSGNTRDVTRRQVVESFKHGDIKVLCNCEVLTTGFDAPKVTHVIMARPTISQVLYEQMVGRGLRGPRFGGTQNCIIVDCEDNYRVERPVLGYKRFREVWGPKPRASR